MRTLLVGPLPPPMNGCSYANAVLVRRLGELGFSCATVDTSTSTISGRQGSRFSIVKAVRFARTYWGTTRVFSSDVIYVTPGQTFFGVMKYSPFFLLSLLLRKPYVVHVHGNHLGAEYASMAGLRRILFRFFLNRAAAGVVLSESLRANFDQLLPSRRIYVVENFAGDDIYKNCLGKKKQCEKLKVLYLSNLMREKGILELLDALIQLRQSGVDFEARIAGHMEAGIEAEVSTRLASLADVVRYVGVVSGSSKSDLLAWANVSVLPTYYSMEGQPIALLEGLAAGNIIVTTRHAGIPDVIDESHGFLIPVRDTAEIARVLSLVGSNVEGQVSKYSSRNATYAAGRFTEEAFAMRILSVLARVTGNRNALKALGKDA